MCLIVSSESGKLIDLDDLQIAYSNNPDGVGVMWLENGRVQEYQVVPSSFEQVKDIALGVAGFPHALHLRYCTRGEVNKDNCHPFTVLNSDQGDSCDISLMHNGTFSWIKLTTEQEKSGISDTGEFARRIQKNLRLEIEKQTEHVETMFNPTVISKFSSRISSWNKVVMMTSTGRFLYLNKVQGTERNDMWYSNTYSLKEGYRHEQVKHHGPKETTTIYSYGNSSYASSNTNSTSTSASNSKESFAKPITETGKTTTYFKRSSSMNALYMVKSNNYSDDFVVIDPETKTEVKSGRRIGKKERKQLQRFLENEKKASNGYKREAKVDDKGRKIHTVSRKTTEVLEPNEFDELETEDTLVQSISGIHPNMFH